MQEFGDELFAREYDFSRYNCFHFVCDLLQSLKGQVVSYEQIVADVQGQRKKSRRLFMQVSKPTTGTLCLFKGSKSDELHCGIFYRGKVLHIQEHGVAWQPLHVVMLFYNKVVFYEYRNNN